MDKWTAKEIAVLQESYTTCSPQEWVALFPNKTKVAIRNKAQRLGLFRKRESGWNRKYPVVNEHCFDVLSPTSSYWLGFIWADGFVSDGTKRKEYSLGVNLNKRDANHLNKLLDFVGCRRPLYDLPKQCVGVRISNRTIYDSLLLYGITNTKKLRTSFPNGVLIDEEILRSFVRGYFDGDGSLFLSETRQSKPVIRLNFTGCEDFICTLGNEMNRRFGTKCTPMKDKRSNAWRYQVNNRKSGIQMLSWMYDGDGEALDRKKKLFLGLKLCLET